MRPAFFAPSALILIACGGSSSAPESAALTRSLTTWGSAKGAGSSYDYSVPGGSWTGFAETTTLTVRSNEVVARSYSSTNLDDSGSPVPADSWSETGADVGSHAAGARPRRLEDLYAQCSDEVLTQDRGANDVFLTFDPQGILETCVYVPKGCQDDCSHGVQVRNVTIAK